MDLGYEFKNKKLMETAFTHISYAREKQIESNQRMEFFGDSILSFVVAEYLYHQNQKGDEGVLTESRAMAVREETLAKAARSLGLGKMLRFGKSEEICGGEDKDSILADAYEAVLAAIYLDSDMDTAREWVKKTLGDISEALNAPEIRNYKSQLQLYFQKRDHSREYVSYRMVKKHGPDHDPTFDVEAVYRNQVIGHGSGGNRKKADQQAAKDALLRLGIKENYES